MQLPFSKLMTTAKAFILSELSGERHKEYKNLGDSPKPSIHKGDAARAGILPVAPSLKFEREFPASMRDAN